MKAYHVTKILNLGSGYGRDTTFLGSKGIEVEALNYSVIAVEILDKIAKGKRLPIKSQIYDAKNQLPFPDYYFDAVYSHILLNTMFSLDGLHIFRESRVLKPKGLNFYSVRNHNDASCRKDV